MHAGLLLRLTEKRLLSRHHSFATIQLSLGSSRPSLQKMAYINILGLLAYGVSGLDTWQDF